MERTIPIKDYRYEDQAGDNPTEQQYIDVKPGDWICFKSDIEQSGKITRINGAHITVENENGLEGCYLRGQTTVTLYKGNCWVE